MSAVTTSGLKRGSIARVVSGILIAETLIFALGVTPEHISALSSHDDCQICTLIHHPPVLQPDSCAIGLLPERHPLKEPELHPALSEPVIESDHSRAPPPLV
ncbi:MAG: hypothetical protein GXX84_09955 [Acidobacteria bacterium]|nr:hypothetical protein [Acidobacteriota bacterium]